MRLRGSSALAAGCFVATAVACGANPGSHQVRNAATSAPPPRAGEAPPAQPATLQCGPRVEHRAHTTVRTGSSAILTEVDGHSVLYAASADERAIYSVDPSSLELLAVTPLDGEPAELLALSDGRVLVTLRDRNRLAAFEPVSAREPLELRCDVATYTEPFGLAASPDGSRVAVTSGFGHRVAILEASSLSVARAEQVSAEPRGVLISDDGDSVYVSHAIGGVVSYLSLTHPELGVSASYVRSPTGSSRGPELSDGKLAKMSAGEFFDMLKRPTGHFDPRTDLAAAQGFALAEMSLGETDGHRWPGRIFVPMTTSDPARAASPTTYGSNPDDPNPALVGAFVAVIDPRDRIAIGQAATVSRNRAPEDCILPRGVTTWEKNLVVACLGSDKLEVLDARGADPISLVKAQYPIAPGSTGVAVDTPSGRAFVLSSWNAGITVVDLAKADAAPRFIPLPHREGHALSAEAERGRELFHATRDTRLSSDGRACSSCHPDGRADGLTWATPDGPRQTIPLAGRMVGHAGFGWFGDHPTLETHLQFTVSRLSGTGLRETRDQRDLAALASYVRTLRLPSRDGALDDADDAAVRARGKEIFESGEASCSSCHPGGASDGKRHNVGSGNATETSASFATPSLAGIADTAPYFHDGRYETLFDLVSDPKSQMGHSASLSADDRRALVAYLETIGSAEASGDKTEAHMSSGFSAARASSDVPRVARPTEGMQRVHEEIFATRKPFPGGTIDFPSLPVVEIGPDEKTPTTFPAGNAGETFLAKNDLISLVGFEQWILSVNFETGHTGSGLFTSCHDGLWYDPFERVEYWGINHTPDKGSLELAWADGYLDKTQCKVAITRHSTVRPVHLAGGVVYGFRTHCAECDAGDRDGVALITASDEPFDFSKLRLSGNRSAARESGLPSWALAPWTHWMGPDAGGPSITCTHRWRAELSQADGEGSPSLWVGCD